jgi:hypothetical protein
LVSYSNENKNVAIFIQNPAIDILFGSVGATIPSKRQDFKPIEVTAVHDDGTQ